MKQESLAQSDRQVKTDQWVKKEVRAYVESRVYQEIPARLDQRVEKEDQVAVENLDYQDGKEQMDSQAQGVYEESKELKE